MRVSTRNRRSGRLVRLLVVVAACAGILRAGQVLPVFLADNHAETFGWVARNFDVDSPHVLVLVDAHSDATAAERSEEMREGLRRVASERVRDANVGMWRTQGRLQAFNWVEPLMPRPVSRVCWLAAPRMGEPDQERRQRQAVESLDGRLEAEPRSAGSFADRWRTMDLGRFERWNPGRQRVVLAVDLDFFSGMGAAERELAFQAIWTKAMSWPGLAGVAFAVSRPWLRDDEEADALVALASDLVARTRGALLEIDASVDDRPDDSSRGKEPGKVPRWDAARASAGLRARWIGMGDRVRFVDRSRDWSEVIEAWDVWVGSIRPDAGEVDCDGVWRFSAGDEPVLRVEAPPLATGRVRWHVLEPGMKAVDLLPETGLGKCFAEAPGRWVHETRRFLTQTNDFALPAERFWPGGAGRVRVAAEVECDAGWLPVPPVELRFARQGGFRGALSECFGMPYVFGVAEAAEGDLSGVETGWGSDCANLLVSAWRRNGVPLAWGDPGRLRAQLAVKAGNVRTGDGVAIHAGEVERGIALDFGAHVAAVWEDRPPTGVLGGNDMVVHHLGGFPQVVELSTLTESRPVFALRVPREPAVVCRVKIAGDVVLAREDRKTIDDFGKHGAGLFLVNLEGVPSAREPGRKPGFDFRFPKERLGWLREAGVDAVSMANNHAGDAGGDGLLEGIRAIREAGIGVFGAGANAREACRPWRTERNGVRMAVFGISLVEAMTAGDDHPGVACLPLHEGRLDNEIRGSRASGESVIVLVHGGAEYRVQVDEEQRRWARWLVARGAMVIAGAHPHVVQRGEWHGGAVIAHSLGNAVYPGSLGGAGSGEVRVFDVGPVGFPWPGRTATGR